MSTLRLLYLWRWGYLLAKIRFWVGIHVALSIGQASKLLETVYHIHIHYICICKVFKHLDMLWLTVRPVLVGDGFWVGVSGVDLSLSDVVM